MRWSCIRDVVQVADLNNQLRSPLATSVLQSSLTDQELTLSDANENVSTCFQCVCLVESDL